MEWAKFQFWCAKQVLHICAPVPGWQASPSSSAEKQCAKTLRQRRDLVAKNVEEFMLPPADRGAFTELHEPAVCANASEGDTRFGGARRC